MGIVASKKVGGAVERNRTKRVLREAFRHLPGMFPDGVDLVVIARQGAPEVSFSQACGEMEGVRSLVRRRALEVLRK
jgi:ribonuclease P protein component